MNATRRKAVEALHLRLTLLETDVEQLHDALRAIAEDLGDLESDEQEYFNNMPNSIREGEKGGVVSSTLESFSNAQGELQEILEPLSRGIGDTLNLLDEITSA